MAWKNILNSTSSGKKRIHNNIHSMLQIWRNKLKEQNTDMHRKKYKNIQQYYVVSVISGWSYFCFFYIFLHFPNFLQ